MKYLLTLLIVMGCSDQYYSVPPSSCTTVSLPSGDAQVVCTDGSASTLTKGRDGVPGSKGDTGAQGIQGVPGTGVTTIKFCDDYVPTYPSSFPEYGLCIDNKLYGVYWSVSLGAFLAYLPPGTYRSTNASQACLFTIYPNCIVAP